MGQTQAKYVALVEDAEDSLIGHNNTRLTGRATSLYRLLRWAVIVIVLCSIVDFLLLVYLGLRHTQNNGSALMETRSSYINFDLLYSNTSVHRTRHDPIVNHGRDFVQVSSTEPYRAYPLYGDLVLTEIGPVPPFTRHLLVTSQISTIAQFRVIDYGMESCSLAITTPPKNDTAGIISSSLDLPVSLEVWTLPTKHKLDLAKLTWATRPQPRTHVGTLAISHGATYHMPRFECRSGSYQTFELSCSSPNCHIDIMGVGKGQSGLYMYQYETI
jgi:hypothetical protein